MYGAFVRFVLFKKTCLRWIPQNKQASLGHLDRLSLTFL